MSKLGTEQRKNWLFRDKWLGMEENERKMLTFMVDCSHTEDWLERDGLPVFIE